MSETVRKSERLNAVCLVTKVSYHEGMAGIPTPHMRVVVKPLRLLEYRPTDELISLADAFMAGEHIVVISPEDYRRKGVNVGGEITLDVTVREVSRMSTSIDHDMEILN